MRQLIIARKDLHMSAGKLAVQCCHASMAFMTHNMRSGDGVQVNEEDCDIHIKMNKQCYDEWICGIFTKTLCEAKNRNQLLKAKAIAEELGLKENKDFFLIKDACLTELEPEEIDENGQGRTLTCIGFAPLPDNIAHLISKKFQLYRD